MKIIHGLLLLFSIVVIITFSCGDSYSKHVEKGDSYITEDEIGNAILEYNRAMELSPELATAYYKRSVAYRKVGQYDMAILDLDKAIELAPDMADAYYNRAIVYILQDEPDLAIENMTKAMNLSIHTARIVEPELAFAYYKLGAAYYERHNNFYTRVFVSKALHIDPTITDGYLIRSDVHVMEGVIDQALMDLNKAIELDPLLPSAYSKRGDVYFIMNIYDKAIADFNRAIELDPSLAEAYRERGWTLFYLEDYTPAVDDLTMAIELAPDDYSSYFYRGRVYYAEKKEELALQDFRFIANSSNDASLIFQAEQYINKIEVSGK